VHGCAVVSNIRLFCGTTVVLDVVTAANTISARRGEVGEQDQGAPTEVDS
jgi:hypothetical protein